MELKLTRNQIGRLTDFLFEAEANYDKNQKGVIQAQIYDGFMEVHYIKNECAMEMREIMKKYHPERFNK